MLGAPFTIRPQEHEVFVGMDVDKHSIALTVQDHGSLLKSFKTPYRPNQVIQYVRRHHSDRRVVFAYEAGPTGYGLHDELEINGFPCLVVSPQNIPSLPGERVKTNRRDSMKICEALRGGHLKSIHVPSFPYRQLRHLTQLRDSFVAQATESKMRIKSLLLFEGLPFPSEKGTWTISAMASLSTLPASPAVRFKLDALLETLRFAQNQTIKTQREIQALIQREPQLQKDINLLTTIPGIGKIVAVHLLARIGDGRLIERTKQVPAFLGLVPRENSTGDSVHRGPITKSGDSRLRNKLVQSAWMAIRTDGALAQFYHHILARNPKDHGAGKAIVACARKLAMRVGAVLKTRTEYKRTSLTSVSDSPRGQLDG